MPLDKTVAMINLDMVGRAGGRIMVDGLGNSPSIERGPESRRDGKPAEVEGVARRTRRRRKR